MTAPTPETMSPREKVPYGLNEVISEVRRRYPAAFDGTDPIAVHPPSLENATDLFLACCLASLASSGDHAEPARLAVWRDRLRADPGRAAHFGSPYADKPMQNGRTYWNSDLADDITALIAEVAALRESIGRHDRQVAGMLRARLDATARATEAERKLAEAYRTVRQFVAATNGTTYPSNHPMWAALESAQQLLSKEAERG